jgi:hypothetical protein
MTVDRMPAHMLETLSSPPVGDNRGPRFARDYAVLLSTILNWGQDLLNPCSGTGQASPVRVRTPQPSIGLPILPGGVAATPRPQP